MASTGLRADFPYLDADEVYLDAACQSLRPLPVLDAMTDYYTTFGACGERGRYAWGRRVDQAVEAARVSTLAALRASPRTHTCAFTLNTTMGLNLLLQQLPPGRYARVITTHHEHNSVFLSTMTAARRLGIPRHVVERSLHGDVDLTAVDLTDALVVLSAMDNVTGTVTRDLPAIAAEVHRRGGALLLDAAQAAPHAFASLRGLDADAICFSAHKLYGPSLGVVVATDALLRSLELTFVGGGQVDAVTTDGFVPAAAVHTRLEPGLQAWGEIIGYGAALAWFLPRSAEIERHEDALGARLRDALVEMPNLRVFGPVERSATISVVPERVDAHRLAAFLSQAGIMVRSGHFCAHHWLDERAHLPTLVRFSLGAHTTESDIDHSIVVMDRLMRGL
ncbi:MAG: aminotransferase class V-fold PLP-dependent enzyme [Microbacterium sp.]|uniref:aminotransferase class V-fold PLP-dependent enzyme n=1 Tax=Microbacterium sp. TaxID=51671 RepID=UPI001AC6744A|nr:aminotransferase class V-fold PLP-dependent enzyme [Microbacterium sp.]MBN9176928.1 aminotransferase class V-fold PLP-dependent enzyme [Microbacterium sp.]